MDGSFEIHLKTNSKLLFNSVEYPVDKSLQYGSFANNSNPLRICKKNPYMNTLEKYEIYKACKLEFYYILKHKLYFNINVLYDKVMYAENFFKMNNFEG